MVTEIYSLRCGSLALHPSNVKRKKKIIHDVQNLIVKKQQLYIKMKHYGKYNETTTKKITIMINIM